MIKRILKLTRLEKVSLKTAEEVTNALVDRLSQIQKFVMALTADNGKEFAYHKRVSQSLEANFYFATPYHSWERGLNEHTNGLVLQYLPKNKGFSEDLKVAYIRDLEKC